MSRLLQCQVKAEQRWKALLQTARSNLSSNYTVQVLHGQVIKNHSVLTPPCSWMFQHAVSYPLSLSPSRGKSYFSETLYGCTKGLVDAASQQI